ncbi:hypothetical protein [Streptomyces sp. NPDC019507]
MRAIRAAWERALERQQEVAGGLDRLVRAARQKGRDQPSGADLVRGA